MKYIFLIGTFLFFLSCSSSKKTYETPKTYTEFQEKSYFKLLFTEEDLKALKKMQKIRKKGDDKIEEMNLQLRETENFQRMAKETKDEKVKKAAEKKIAKIQKKADLLGIDAHTRYWQSNNIRLTVYLKALDLNRLRDGSERLTFGQKLEDSARTFHIEAAKKYEESDTAKSESDQHNFLKQGDKLQQRAFALQEKAMGVYMYDAEISITAPPQNSTPPDVVITPNESPDEDTNPVVVPPQNQNPTPPQVVDTRNYSIFYESREDSIIPKLNLAKEDWTKWQIEKQRNEKANEVLQKVGQMYRKIDSLNSLAAIESDKTSKEKLRNEAVNVEKDAFSLLLSAVNMHLESNSTKYSIYRKYFPQFRPKTNSQELSQGKSFETQADQHFNAAKEKIKKSKNQSYNSERYISLMEANESELSALQKQEFAYLIYLKMVSAVGSKSDVDTAKKSAKIDSVKPKKVEKKAKKEDVAKKEKKQSDEMFKNFKEIRKTSEKFYTVQLGNFSLPKTDKDFEDFETIYYEKINDSLFRYFAENCKNKKKAERIREKALNLGFQGAFILLFKDGKKQETFVSETPKIKTQKAEIPSQDVCFRVQVGAYRIDISKEMQKKIKRTSKKYELYKFENGEGFTVYTFGKFVHYGKAESAMTDLKNLGFESAHIVGFQGEKRISPDEAKKLLKQK